MRFQLKPAIKRSLKIVPMQAKLEELEVQLNILEQVVAKQYVKESTVQLEVITNLLKDVFSQVPDITGSDQERLQELNQQLIELCHQLQVARDSSKSELSNIIKNKKKVGLYNQIK